MATVLFTYLSGMSQIKIDTGRAEITLPKYVTWNPDASPLRANDDGTVDVPKGDYKFGACIFSLEYAELQRDTNFLINRKKTLEGSAAIYRRYHISYNSTITRINGYDVLIFVTNGGCSGMIYFYLVNKDYSYLVSGFLDFKSCDEVGVKKHVYDTLKGVKIK